MWCNENSKFELKITLTWALIFFILLIGNKDSEWKEVTGRAWGSKWVDHEQRGWVFRSGGVGYLWSLSYSEQLRAFRTSVAQWLDLATLVSRRF